MKDYKRLKNDLLLLEFIHKRRYYLLITSILSLCMFLAFYFFIQASINIIIFSLLLCLIIVLFILNALANNLIKERSIDPYILDINPVKNDMEIFSIETSAKRKVMGTDNLNQYYIHQKLASRLSGHIPLLNIPEDYPKILMPSLVGYNIYCNYYVNVYNYQNRDFNMAKYKDEFYTGRFNLHKENAGCNSLIIDLIIVDKLNEDLTDYLNCYVNDYLYEPCLYIVIYDNKIYIPPISKNIKYEYQLDAYKEAIKYLKETLL